VYANAIIALDALPGVTLRSGDETPFHMSSEITSYPAINEIYHLVEPVGFENVSAPGKVLATVWTAKILVGPADIQTSQDYSRWHLTLFDFLGLVFTLMATTLIAWLLRGKK
jgi:hypothetical protein